MNPILIATILLSVLGILGAVLLVAASKFLAVTEDEKVEQLQAVLPGANCGGCGYAGCSAYAKAIAEGAPVNQCLAGGAAVAEKIAAIMGVEAGAATEYKAMIACQGDTAHKKNATNTTAFRPALPARVCVPSGSFSSMPTGSAPSPSSCAPTTKRAWIRGGTARRAVWVVASACATARCRPSIFGTT